MDVSTHVCTYGNGCFPLMYVRMENGCFPLMYVRMVMDVSH